MQSFLQSSQGRTLADFVMQRLQAGVTVYPQHPLLALELTPLNSVRVVILGQDPYHGPGQAQGLAFSVAPGVRIPPSLRNIHKELQRDLNLPPPSNGSLIRWARQGVLLLNTCLSVEEAHPGAHAGKGWEALTDEIISVVERTQERVIFMLWGAHAQKKMDLLTRSRAQGRVLCANHPSPLSAARGATPFIGCGHFGMANRWLQDGGHAPIDW